MPKPYPKTQPKKTKPNTKTNGQPKPVSITSSKTYWITLTLLMLVFGSFYGYLMKVALAAIGIMLASVLFLIGFAYYLKFKQSPLTNSSRATFLFGGACVIGFAIWVVIVLLSSLVGLWAPIALSIGDNFFAITSLIICLTSGAFIGDLIGNNKEKISVFLKSKFSK
ncbi:MAG: hypothetical protein ABSF44_03540 [Candidatus Bathyarchaeia archaeon]|jgi:MFS family permease